jgi:hypothetical protein
MERTQKERNFFVERTESPKEATTVVLVTYKGWRKSSWNVIFPAQERKGDGK